MDTKKRRPILYKGEVYSHPIQKDTGGKQKEPSVTYSEARDKVFSEIQTVQNTIESLPANARLPHEYIISLRISSDFSAKSYYPGTLFDDERGLEEVGSRIWRQDENQEGESIGKLFFLRATKTGLQNFQNKLNLAESELPQNFQRDVRKISAINLLTKDEQILGIEDSWKEGRLEAVLHPFHVDNDILFNHFLEKLKNSGVNLDSLRKKQYESGITFVSLMGNRQAVKELSNYNPLRMLHPLEASMPVMRGSGVEYTSDAPLPPDFTSKSGITVGMFDGGVGDRNPFISKYVEEEQATTGKPDTSADVKREILSSNIGPRGPKLRL